jgi:CheY-like chemotaxis protein
MESHNILIVEDEQTLRNSMVRGLSRLSGVHAMDAGTVQEAKRLLRRCTPELVISDLDLPDGSGIEVAAEADLLGLRIPIVFVSAYVGRFRHRIPNRAEVEVHEKPIALERLRGLVEEKLGLGMDDNAPVSPFGVTDYVQLAGMGRHTVVIEVRSMAGEGRLIIKGGELWSAVDSLGSGVDAFRRLVLLRAVHVLCRTLDHGEIPARNIDGSAEAVLLDVARTIDEMQHALQEPPSTLDDGWGDVLDEAPPPPQPSRPRAKTLPSAAEVAPPPENARPAHFDDAFERGVDALLLKDYPAALAAFLDAEQLRPGDRRVLVNLRRLHDMGFA